MTSHQWQWKNWNGSPYLTCSLFDGWQHGWLTQQFSPRSPFEITPELFPGATAYRVMQVHGNTVLAPSEMASPLHNDNLSDGDGVISQGPQQAMWVCTADCTPVLMGDVRTGQAAAIHAGWRGTAQKIVPMAIDRLVRSGSRLADLRIGMGPAVSGSAYQVDRAVGLETALTLAPELANLPQQEAIEQLQAWSDSPILADAEVGKVRLDVRRVNALQLEQLGIQPEQISIAPHCTYSDPVHFFSYRRETRKKAQWSGIVSR